MRVSEQDLNEQDWQEMWNHLIHTIRTHAPRRSQLEIILKNLLPPAERQILAKRLMIGALSLAGWPARDIANSLKLSKATVYKYIALLEQADAYKEILMPIAEGIRAREETAQSEKSSESIWSKIW